MKFPFPFISTFLFSLISVADIETKSETESKDYYKSVVFGTGDSSVGGALQWHAFEVRVGQKNLQSNTDSQTETIKKIFCQRLDYIHKNEGHPINNHRDGFAIQCVSRKKIGNQWAVEGGMGPYFSMNTTKNDENNELNDKRIGYLATIAVLWYYNSNTHLRASFNQAKMKDAFRTNSYLIGVGNDFSELENVINQNQIEVSFFISDSRTTRSHAKHVTSKSIEIKTHNRIASDARVHRRWSYSMRVIDEGDDERFSDRKGLAFQIWNDISSKKWRFSVGTGPYVSRNHRNELSPEKQNGLTKLSAIFSIRASYRSSQKTNVILDFSRIASGQNIDKDLGSFGISRQFNE